MTVEVPVIKEIPYSECELCWASLCGGTPAQHAAWVRFGKKTVCATCLSKHKQVEEIMAEAAAQAEVAAGLAVPRVARRVGYSFAAEMAKTEAEAEASEAEEANRG